MDSMREIICNKADEFAIDKYNQEFYLLTPEQQDEIWELAVQAGEDWLAAQINRTMEQ